MARTTTAYNVRINTHSADTNALILLAAGELVGIVIELSDACHEGDQGKWAIETAFGINEKCVPDTFGSANDAANWLSDNFGCAPFELGRNIVQLR